MKKKKNPARIICNFLFVCFVEGLSFNAFLAVIYRKNVSFRASVNATFFQVKFTATKKTATQHYYKQGHLKILHSIILFYIKIFFLQLIIVHYHCEIYMPLLAILGIRNVSSVYLHSSSFG